LLDLGRDGSEISNLEKRVGGAFQKNHGSLSCFDVRVKIYRISGINMVNDDAAMSFEIGEEAIRATVQVIACDDLITWLEKAENDIEGGHPGGDCKRMAC
jgi:hypothetical protein